MKLARAVSPGEAVRLATIDQDADGDLSKARADDRLAELSRDIGDLQELLYAAHRHALLIVLQGMDTSGKDGTIKHVMSDVNPQGCRVVSFKAPTADELDHDFLWRVHQAAPGRGLITIFNRSHYEDVLVARVHDLVPRSVWEPRYDHIVSFERLLADHETIVLKFYLHISRDEQADRLLAREEDPAKAWKLSANDWRERRYWKDYMRAYEDALGRTSTPHAPWYIVPANKKWVRNLAVAEVVRDALDAHRHEWKATLRRVARTKLAELRALRARSPRLRRNDVKRGVGKTRRRARSR